MIPQAAKNAPGLFYELSRDPGAALESALNHLEVNAIHDMRPQRTDLLTSKPRAMNFQSHSSIKNHRVCCLAWQASDLLLPSDEHLSCEEYGVQRKAA